MSIHACTAGAGTDVRLSHSWIAFFIFCLVTLARVRSGWLTGIRDGGTLFIIPTIRTGNQEIYNIVSKKFKFVSLG